MNAKEALTQTGKNLQSVRIEKGYSIATLAILSGVDESAITDMEAGRFDFPVEFVFDLAATLNVDFRRIIIDEALYRS